MKAIACDTEHECEICETKTDLYILEPQDDNELEFLKSHSKEDIPMLSVCLDCIVDNISHKFPVRIFLSFNKLFGTWKNGRLYEHRY